MSVLFDYFRAPGLDGVRTRMAGGPTGDATEIKGVDPTVALGRLVALVSDVPYARGDHGTVWPEGDTDLEYMGPWVRALDDRTRDALAGVAESEIPALATRWCAIDDFGNSVSADDLRAALTDLTALASRARAHGDSLYCRVSI